MANFELANDAVASIPITTVDTTGAVVPAPSGDIFSVVVSDVTKMTAVIGVMPSGPVAGAVALILTPLVQVSPGLTVTVSDTAALTSATVTVDLVDDVTPKGILPDVAGVVFTPQPVPVAAS